MAVALEDTVAVAPDSTLTERGPALPHGTPRLGAGKQLGHFRIERLLGAGGMGEVYLATDLALDRPVAIKVLPEAAAKNPDRRDRLIREARAQARISHPNVGHIYFIGEDGDRLYFAMEYVSGETLADKLANGPLPVEDALAYVRAAVLGLREAWRHGVTHRDVKPSNLMLDANGLVKLLDFGLAAQHVTSEVDRDAPVAQTSIAGTPLYMAPEQARGEPVDVRADIYALGATLYHLVSGAPPFEADSADALRTKHETAERPHLRRRAGQPRVTTHAVERLCARMMAPLPGDRFASYDDLLRELDLVSTEQTRPAGAIVRSIAMLIDLILAVIVLALVTLLMDAVGGRDTDIESLVSALLFGMLQVVQLARWGRSAGQELFELRVVDIATGGRPSWRQAAIRVTVALAVPLGLGIYDTVVDLLDYERIGALQAVLVLMPIALIYAAWRVPGKQTVWDRASRTAVRYQMRR